MGRPVRCISPGYQQVLDNTGHQMLSRMKCCRPLPLGSGRCCGLEKLRNRTPGKWALSGYHESCRPWDKLGIFRTSFPSEVRYLIALGNRTACRKGGCDLGDNRRQDSTPDSLREKPDRSLPPLFRGDRSHFLPDRTGYILAAGADVGADCSMLLFWRR